MINNLSRGPTVYKFKIGKIASSLAAGAIGALLLASPLAAQGTGETAEFGSDKNWEVIVTPINGLLAWGVHGKIKGARTDAANISLSPIEFWQKINPILDALQFIALPTVEVRRGEFGVGVDLMTLTFQADQPLKGLFFSGITTSFETTTAAFTGSYRFYQTERALLDIVGGARMWNTNFSVNVAGGRLLPGIGRTTKDTWFDPIIGVSGRYNLTDNVYLGGYANVGGLVNSDVTWDLFGKLGYQAHEALDLYAGFRYLGVNYSNNGAIFNLGVYSPAAGVTFRF